MNTPKDSQTATAPAVASSELLACPFCGGPHVGLIPGQAGGRNTVVLCCSTIDCTAYVWGTTEEQAIRRWNRRQANNEVTDPNGLGFRAAKGSGNP